MYAKPPTRPTEVMRKAARQLRQRETRSEALLWAVLRDRENSPFKWRRQAPWGPYVLDFYCARLKLALEIDGVVHDTPDQQTRDQIRNAQLAQAGILVIHLKPEQVMARLPELVSAINRRAGQRQAELLL